MRGYGDADTSDFYANSMTAETLAGWLDDAERKFGDDPALVFDGMSISFRELAARARALADGLAEHGVQAGDRVAIWLLNEPDWLSFFLACARIGAIAVAVNTRFRATELSDIFDRVRPKAIVCRSKFRSIDFLGLIAQAAEQTSTGPDIVVTLDRVPREAAISADDLICEKNRAPSGRVEAETSAIMFSTSGTTSAPKFVVHPHRSIIEHARDVAEDFGMAGAGTVLLQALPYCGVFGFSQALAALDVGRCSIVQDVFDPIAAVDAIAAHRVTHFNVTDEMLTSISEVTPHRDISSLRLVGAASFNRGPEVLTALAETRNLPIVGLYGMSEAQALFARRHVEDSAGHRFRAGGRPVSKRANVRVRDPETGNLLGPGEAGELEITGPSRFSGYFENEDATERAVTSDGYVRTGDLGYLQEDGSFTFQSRIGDALRLGGYLVNPDEISGFIRELDQIADCVVVGVMAEGRLRSAAFVKPASGQDFDHGRVLEACRRELAPYKVPVIVHALDAFPVADGPNGEKVQRGALRHLAAELVEN